MPSSNIKPQKVNGWRVFYYVIFIPKKTGWFALVIWMGKDTDNASFDKLQKLRIASYKMLIWH